MHCNSTNVLIRTALPSDFRPVICTATKHGDTRHTYLAAKPRRGRPSRMLTSSHTNPSSSFSYLVHWVAAADGRWAWIASAPPETRSWVGLVGGRNACWRQGCRPSQRLRNGWCPSPSVRGCLPAWKLRRPRSPPWIETASGVNDSHRHPQ